MCVGCSLLLVNVSERHVLLFALYVECVSVALSVLQALFFVSLKPA